MFGSWRFSSEAIREGCFREGEAPAEPRQLLEANRRYGSARPPSSNSLSGSSVKMIYRSHRSLTRERRSNDENAFARASGFDWWIIFTLRPHPDPRESKATLKMKQPGSRSRRAVVNHVEEVLLASVTREFLPGRGSRRTVQLATPATPLSMS